MKKVFIVIVLFTHPINYLFTSPYLTTITYGDQTEKTRMSPTAIAFKLLAKPDFLQKHEPCRFTVTKMEPDDDTNKPKEFDSVFAFLDEYARKKRRNAIENIKAAEHWLSLAYQLNALGINHQKPDSVKKAHFRAYAFIDRALTMPGDIAEDHCLEIGHFLKHIIKSDAHRAAEAAVARLYYGIIKRILSDPDNSPEGITLILESLKSPSLPKRYREKAVYVLGDILKEKGVISDTL